MKKRMLIITAIAALLLLPLTSVMAADVFITKTELIQWDPDRAYEGYNLFVNNGSNWLIDMEGRVINRWDPYDVASFGMYSYLMENGNLRAHSNPSYVPGTPLQAGGSQGRIEEYSWDGERIWWMDVFDGVVDNGDGTYSNLGREEGGATYRFHHDAQRMYNQALGEWTYLVLVWVAKGQDDADKLGVDPALNSASRDASGTNRSTWSPDALVEILPDYASGEGGTIVWYWTFADHMVTTDPGGTAATEPWTDWSGRTAMPAKIVSGTDADTDSIRANPQLLNVNGLHYTVPDGPAVDIQHCNSIDYDENTGYIAINAKAANEFFVIDHDGTFDVNAANAATKVGRMGRGGDVTDEVGALARTSAGDFLYRFGNPSNYYSGRPAGFYDEGDMEMYGTHDIQWIMDFHWRPPMDSRDTWEDPADYGSQYALPGAGNFIMFDNGCYNPMNAGSKILEVNPYLNADGVEQAFYVDPGPDAINSTGMKRRGQVVWTYGGVGRVGAINDFYSSYISGQTRMPNGNTIICSGSHSHLFEVTEDKQVVWEYVMPPWDPTAEKFTTTKSTANMLFRFHRYAADHPALKGRNLTAGPTLTGFPPATLAVVAEGQAPEPEQVVIPTGWGTSAAAARGEGGGGGAGGGTGGGGTY